MAALEDSKTCARCGMAAATTRCTGCDQDLTHFGDLSPTYYCGKNCQKADWPTHKLVCRPAIDRKVLYRGAELLQEIFYALREALFDRNIDQVTKHTENDKLDIFQTYDNTNGRLLFSFPDQNVPDVWDKKALLSFNACGDAVACLHEVAQNIFGDNKRITIKELKVFTKQGVCRIRSFGQHLEDRYFYPHDLMTAELKDGTKYAIDLAGAQFGQMLAVIPWEQYTRGYFLGVKSQHEPGSENVAYKELAKSPENWTARLAESFGRYIDVLVWQ